MFSAFKTKFIGNNTWPMNQGSLTKTRLDNYETLFTHIIITKRAVIFPKVCFLAASNEGAPAEPQVVWFLVQENTSKL